MQPTLDFRGDGRKPFRQGFRERLLAFSKPQLAFVREQLLEADLMEAERHISLIEPLVGNAKSLIQLARSGENAISVLRRIRKERAERFGCFIRFGDPQGTTSAAQLR